MIDMITAYLMMVILVSFVLDQYIKRPLFISLAAGIFWFITIPVAVIFKIFKKIER